jgi:hypothetical protein
MNGCISVFFLLLFLILFESYFAVHFDGVSIFDVR